MRVLIIAFGSHGDVLPMIAIGADLVRRGHKATLASAEPFGEMARRCGLEFESLFTSEQYREALEQPNLWRPLRGARRLFELAPLAIRPAFDFVARNRRPGREIVVATSLSLGARVAHDKFHPPFVTVHMSPMMVQSRFDPPRLPGVPPFGWLPPQMNWNFQLGVDERFIDPAVTPVLNAFRAEIGLPPVKRLRHWFNAPRRVLLMFPDWFSPPRPDWPEQARQCGFPRPDLSNSAPDIALDAFLEGGAAPVFVTFGTAMRHGADLYRATVAACAKLGLRCVVASPEPLDLPGGPGEGVLAIRSAPLARTLPRCAAIVHHGGVGTCAEAFAAGTPQIVVPLAFDQFDNADRVRRLGCGTSISRLTFGQIRAARALASVTSSGPIKARCAEVAGRFEGQDPVAAAADHIEAEFEDSQLRARQRKERQAAADLETQPQV